MLRTNRQSGLRQLHASTQLPAALPMSSATGLHEHLPWLCLPRPTCSFTVLVQLNCSTRWLSSTCRTHTTLYSVSSSVSCAGLWRVHDVGS